MCLGIPGKVVSLEGSRASVEIGGVRIDVDVSLVDNVRQGDYLLVHSGFAINKIDEEDAHNTLDLIREIARHDTENPETKTNS